MINGEGFFVVTDDPNYENRFFTRAGNFTLDRDGNLVTVDGYKVLGYTIDEDGQPTNTIAPVRINRSETAEPAPTTKIEIRGNLDSRTNGEEHLADTIIKDSLGNSYVATFKFNKVQDASGDEYWVISLESLKPQSEEGGTNILNNPITVFDRVTFNQDGKLTTATQEAQINLNDMYFGDEGIITIDCSGLTQYANEMDAKPFAMDGNSSGTLEGYTIDTKGVVYGVFSNGESKPLAQLVLAKFDNPMGLQKVGSNLFNDSRNSGEPQYGVADSGGFGSISSGALEMSNVDLAYEFTEMITTQRGFQANSRIITVSDEMLQELVNIKR